MSVYAIDEVCYRLVHDPPFRRAAVADVAAATRDTDLTAAERDALLAGDVATLYRMGAHPFLLGHLARFGVAGLDTQTYSERIRSAV
jgi:aromatic-ring opening dioxygenase LigAB LigA subunit